VVGQFTAPGSLVVYTLNRNKERRDYNSTIRGGLDIPLVVMVNRYSASASEITAGALRDHKVATLVGEKTFGKGSVQQLYPFSNESALKLTIARFYSPAGHVIDHKGLVPEYAVAMEPRLVGKLDQDIQLQKAIRVIQSGKARP
jgi:carboxyl-terminal processing protease